MSYHDEIKCSLLHFIRAQFGFSIGEALKDSRTLINPLYTNGFFLLVSYNQLGIVHCTYLGVSGYNSKKKKKMFFFCLKIFFFTLTNSVDPDEMQH